MKNVSFVLAILLVTLFVVPVFPKESKPQNYLPATVLRVDKHDNQSNFVGGNPSDAPLPDPETYVYDVSLHVNCGTYVGRYESWYDYVPSLLSANQKVQVRLTKRVMYVPAQNQKEIEMPIVSKHVERGPCMNVSR